MLWQKLFDEQIINLKNAAILGNAYTVLISVLCKIIFFMIYGSLKNLPCLAALLRSYVYVTDFFENNEECSQAW